MAEIFNSELPKSENGTQGSASATPPKKTSVIVGIASDSQTEIISGLKEGEIIVTKTITNTTTTKTTSTKSILGGMGGGPRN